MPVLKIRLGTRASALARWQADWVAARLTELGTEVELVPITTSGDTLTGPLGVIGGQGLFTKEIQRALLDNRVDLAVHSLKDLPTDDIPELCLAAVPLRAPVGDVLVCRDYGSLAELPEGATVGTGSLRRKAQLLHVRADLQIKEIRGNVETRLKKVEDKEYDAIILAEAGLTRLELRQHIAERISLATMLPAIGQGALGLETRSDDQAVREQVGRLSDTDSYHAILAERAMLAALQGGCLAPIAGWARLEDGQLKLTGRVIAGDGTKELEAEQAAALQDDCENKAIALGRQVADKLLAQGAATLIHEARETS